MADVTDQLRQTKQPAGGGDYAPWWNDDNFNRQEGDELIGVIVEKHDYTDPGGGEHPVATLKMIQDCAVPEGSEVATPTHSGCTDVVEDAEVGDVLLLEFTGIVKSNSGRDTNTYEYSRLTEDEWQETDQADHIQEIWDSWSPGNSSAPESSSSDGDDMDALDFAETSVTIQGGEVTIDELEDYVVDVRGFDADVEALVEESEVLERDGDTVTLVEE